METTILVRMLSPHPKKIYEVTAIENGVKLSVDLQGTKKDILKILDEVKRAVKNTEINNAVTHSI